MAESQNTLKQETVERIIPPEKVRRYRLICWSLIFIAILSYCIFYGIGLTILLGIYFFLFYLAKSWGTKLNVILFPNTFTDKVKSTKVYQIYFLGAPRRKTTLAILLLAFFPTLWLIVSPNVWINPVLDLQEMDLYKGTVVKFRKGTRTRPSNFIWIRTRQGKTLKFGFAWTKERGKYLKKLSPRDEIQVRAQTKWRIPGIRVKRIFQMKHNEHFIGGNNYDKNRSLRLNETLKKIDIFCLLFDALILAIVWVRAKKDLQEGEANEK